MTNRLLRRRIDLADGTELRTTGDAHALITQKLASSSDYLELQQTVAMLKMAAESGKRAHIKAATDQLVVILRRARMM